MKTFTNNNLHVHTDASLNDGAQTVEEAVKRLKELSVTACAITDHGVCANWIPWYNTCIKNGIKPILGVEAYISGEIVADKETYQHLLLLAKNYNGLQRISRFVSECNKKINPMGKPIGTLDMVQKYFGSESEGDVICTTACIGGTVASVLSYNSKIEKEIQKIIRRNEKIMESLPEDFIEVSKKVETVMKQIDLINYEIDEVSIKAKKTFKETKATVRAEKDPAIKAFLQKELDREVAETKAAKERIKVLKEKKKELNSSIVEDKKVISKFSTKNKTINENQEKIESLKKSMKTEETLMEEGTSLMMKYQAIFKDNFYAEVQYHGIEAEKEIYPKIAKIAKKCNVPLIASNDVHIASKNDAQKRNLIQNCAYITSATKFREPIVGDSELYFKTGNELADMLRQILSEEEVVEAMNNIDVVCEKCNLPQLVDPKNGATCFSLEKHYPKFDHADDRLRELATKGRTVVSAPGVKEFEIIAPGIEGRYPNFPESYRKQMEYELSVISKMGFSSYFLFIADVISMAKRARENAIDIGPARGSGAGSIVCYLTDITALDPMVNGLMFERFLNPERVSMPDIDTDYSKFSRILSINYVKEKYGEKAVAGIMTKGRMAAKSALTYAPKLLGLERFGDKKHFNKLGADIRSIIGDEPNAKLADYDEKIRERFSDNEEALTILTYANMLEGYITSFGQHAAGLICIQNDAIENYIPLMAVKDTEGNESFVIQADMIEAEGQLGFIKFDFLGLKNLNIITAAMHMIKKTYNVEFDPYKLPFEKEVFTNIFSKADTNFVFQFESEGMKKMLKELQPTCFGDIVLAVSVYRPGPMDFIPDIISAKRGESVSEIVNRIPVLKDVYAETYGYPVYQEQVMRTFTTCANFSAGKADEVRRHMSKKHEKELGEIRPEFVEGCKANGIKEEDSNWLFDQLMPFAKYGFNKSHAAAYSLVSYMTAWLKHHYTKEYLCAAMATQTDKTFQLQSDCKEKGIELYRPDINNSDVDYSVYNGGIIVGLSAIKGLKEEAKVIVEARKKEGLFESLEDLIKRVSIRSNNLEALVLSSACDTFVSNRISSAEYASLLKNSFNKISDLENKISEIKKELMGAVDEKEITKMERSLKVSEKNLTEAKQELNNIPAPSRVFLSATKRLAFEMKYLDMWITGNPLEDYDVSKYKCISNVNHGDVKTLAGVIVDFKMITTKNGAEMGLCTLMDKNGDSIKVVCFPATFEIARPYLEDGKVVSIKGEIKVEDEDLIEIFAQEVTPLCANSDNLVISVKDIEEYKEVVEPLLLQYQNMSGITVSVFNAQMKEVRDVIFKVSASENLISALRNAGIEFI